MTETSLNLRLDKELKSAFADLAKAQDRSISQLLRVLMREEIARHRTAGEHESWFRGEVETALAEAADPKVARVPDRDVRADWHRRRATLARSAGSTRV